MGTVFKVPYERGTSILSIVILTIFTSLFYGVFTRKWPGLRIMRAVGLTMTAAIVSQLVVFLSTLLSYLLGIDSYFSHPIALVGPEAAAKQTEAISLAAALGLRAAGLVANTLLNGIAGALGWVLGALLPKS